MESPPSRDAAEAKYDAKNWDAAILNDPATFGSDTITAELLRRDSGWTDMGSLSKAAFAAALIDTVEQLAHGDA